MISDWVHDDRLTVCVDFRTLGGFLAVEPTRTLGEELGVTIDWLPLTAGVENYQGGTAGENADDPLAEYKVRRRRARERYFHREMERNCERLGISAERGSRTFDSGLAATGLLWVRKCGANPTGYVREVFELAFKRALSVEEPRNIEKVLEGCGVPRNGFAEYCESTGGAELESLQKLLADEGVFKSPGYLYKGERFLGREHLPLLRWYLGGREGPPPV